MPATPQQPVASAPPATEPPTIRLARATIVWKCAQSLCRIATTLLFDLKVYGRHHVPRTGGVLLVSNHQSMLDPVLLGVRIERAMSYLAKSELFVNPLFGGLIRALNAFPVRQGAGDVGAMKQTIARLAAGDALTIFPEGTRTPDGNISPLEKGVGLVVRRAKVAVVPAVVDGAFDAWPLTRKMFRPAPVRVMFGPPMHLAHLKPDQIVAEIEKTLRRMLDELRAKPRPGRFSL